MLEVSRSVAGRLDQGVDQMKSNTNTAYEISNNATSNLAEFANNVQETSDLVDQAAQQMTKTAQNFEKFQDDLDKMASIKSVDSLSIGTADSLVYVKKINSKPDGYYKAVGRPSLKNIRYFSIKLYL